MQHLSRAFWERFPMVRITSLLVLVVSLPLVTTAASITYTYSADFSFSGSSHNDAQVQLPIVGFDRSLGRFSAASVNLQFSVYGTVTFSCAASGLEQRNDECGYEWGYSDPETGQWVPVWSHYEDPNCQRRSKIPQ